MGDQTAWAMARVEQFLDEHGSSKVRATAHSAGDPTGGLT